MAKQYYCFLERFNNYFNRKVIRHESLEDYQNASEDSFIPTLTEGAMMPFDFNPNDNITTEIIANEVPFDPDYFLLLDAEGDIVSRWFVLEQKRNRQGQWLYYLRRDVLADSYNEIAKSPMFVEKGIISDLDSPLLLNNEDIRVNQIKKSEYLLKDRSKCAWLVLYLKKGVLGSNTVGNNGKITIDVSQNDDFVYETLSTPITSWGLYQYVNTDYKVSNFAVFAISLFYVDMNNSYDFKFWTNEANSSFNYRNLTRGNLSARGRTVEEKLVYSFVPSRSSLYSQALTAFGYNSSDSSLRVYDGKIIKDSDGKYFKIRVYNSSEGSQEHDITTADASALKNSMTNLWNTALEQTVQPNDKAFRIKFNYSNVRIELTELPNFQTEIDFSAYTGEGTKDSTLYDVVCLPYGFVWMRSDAFPAESWASIPTEKERSVRIMASLTSQLTSLNVLDLQILPYCPNRSALAGPNLLVIPDDPNGTCLVGKYNGNITDLIVVCEESNITFDLDVTSNLSPLTIEDDSEVPETYKRKYVNDCTMIRLCSPNYNGVFEFNLAKNGGSIKIINVDMTLRPYNPYIHANPNFNFLYGEDFNDQRGLVCGGDFSLGIIDDAWNVYEIQNKNFQAIFDRQIQNLDINNAITMQESLWGAVAGTVQGASAGAVGGAMVGGGYGAIAGAVAGGVASGIGGAMDIANLQKRQQEARSYAIDNYNLQLGNVRALPNSITKTSALTFNNKLFIFYEIYECSEEEKEAYYLKLKYNGMTIGKIDNIEPYRSLDNSNYLRARLIRCEDISEDNHYVATINEELMKGVFI